MYLQIIEISNFRGIRHLRVNFEKDNTILIGENAWGKSSLLSALWMILGQEDGKLCKFSEDDLYVPIKLDENIENIESICQNYNTEQNSTNILEKIDCSKLSEFYKNQIQDDYEFYLHDIFKETSEKIEINLIFSQSSSKCALTIPSFKSLQDVAYKDTDNLYKIHYQVIGQKINNEFVTTNQLLDQSGKVLENSITYIHELIQLNPLLRLRDRRMIKSNDLQVDKSLKDSELKELNRSIRKFFNNIGNDEDLNSSKINSGIAALNTVATKYLVNYKTNLNFSYDQQENQHRSARDIVSKPVSVNTLNNLTNTLKDKKFSKDKFLLSMLAGALLMAKGSRTINNQAKPILVLEDIEGRFHPTLLLSLWSILQILPIQKIVTTNSPELVSAISLHSLRRLCRQFYDVRCFQVKEKTFNSEDARKIAFHIRRNRPNVLFARTWILVEGETEVWMLSEVAAILGIDLPSEGIKIIEYAQCGLSPLLKLATTLGISFFVLTDGDEAGERYADTARNYISAKNLNKCLCKLPNQDIEHFLYNAEYASVYQKAAGVVSEQDLKLAKKEINPSQSLEEFKDHEDIDCSKDSPLTREDVLSYYNKIFNDIYASNQNNPLELINRYKIERQNVLKKLNLGVVKNIKNKKKINSRLKSNTNKFKVPHNLYIWKHIKEIKKNNASLLNRLTQTLYKLYKPYLDENNRFTLETDDQVLLELQQARFNADTNRVINLKEPLGPLPLSVKDDIEESFEKLVKESENNETIKDVYLTKEALSKRGMSPKKVIDKAIRKMTKPGLAIMVVEEMQSRGESGVPELFKEMFKNIQEIAHKNSTEFL